MFHAEILSKLENVKITAKCGTILDKAEAMATKFSLAIGYEDVGTETMNYIMGL